MSQSIRESWEDEVLFREGMFWCDDSAHSSRLPSAAKSSLPVVRQAVHNERVGADNRADRMTIWMRNVESACPSCMVVLPR
jgi:hypothetical protein